MISYENTLLRVGMWTLFRGKAYLPKVVQVVDLRLTVNENIVKKYTTTNVLMKGRSTCVINFIKVLEALDKPNGMTNHSYRSSLVLKVIFHLSHDLILTW